MADQFKLKLTGGMVSVPLKSTQSYTSPETLLEIFQQRDGMSREDAIDLIEQMKQEVFEGADLEEVLSDYGLEPDYIFEILPL